MFRVPQIAIQKNSKFQYCFIIIVTGIAVECFIAEWDVMGWIPGAGPILGILEYNWEIKKQLYALQVAKPLPGSDDHVNMVILFLKTIQLTDDSLKGTSLKWTPTPCSLHLLFD